MRYWLFRRLNRIVARLTGSVGWCDMAYKCNRLGLPEEEDEDGVWAVIPPEGRLKAWWGAFMFEYKGLD